MKELERVFKQMMENHQTSNVSDLVRHDKKTILLPEGMSLRAGARELERMHQENEEIVDVIREYDWQWKDLLVGIKRVMHDTFGWVPAAKDKFGNTPKFIDIVTNIDKHGNKTTEEAFYGNINISEWDDATLNINIGSTSNISVEVKKKYKKAVSQLLDSIEKYLTKNSIYKNKALEVKYTRQGLEFELMAPSVDNNIVLMPEATVQIKELIIPDLSLPGKTISLFSGPYGNGKTASITNISVEAVRRGLTYFYIKDSDNLVKCLKMAPKYGACMIFMEDIDEVTSGSARTHKLNHILNTLDGTELKNSDLKIFFTTNHPERITQAMRRSKRIDYLVHLGNPGVSEKIDIIKAFAKTFKGYKDLDWETISSYLERDANASFWASAGGRLRLLVKDGVITTEDVIKCIQSIQGNIDFMESEIEEVGSFQIKAGRFMEHISELINNDDF